MKIYTFLEAAAICISPSLGGSTLRDGAIRAGYLIGIIGKNQYTLTPVCRPEDGWVTGPEAMELSGAKPDTFYKTFRGLPDNTYTELNGHKIEKYGEGRRRMYRFAVQPKTKEKAKPEPVERVKPSFVRVPGCCDGCGVKVTPRRTIHLDALQICTGCWQQAMVDVDYVLRGRLGI